MLKKLLFAIYLIPLFICAQNDSIIKGKIVSSATNLEGVHIINLSSNSGVVSDERGYFTIKAKCNDSIMFSAIFLEGKKIVIKKEDFQNELLLVNLIVKVQNLAEVVMVEYPEINAESLGIVSKGQKKYTPAEKKLFAAGSDFKWYSPLLIPLGGMSVDGLINDISGRKKALKEGVVIEKKDAAREKIRNFYDKEYFVSNFKIPANYIDGFLFFVTEDKILMEALKKDNKTEITFILNQLAIAYLETISIDSESKQE